MKPANPTLGQAARPGSSARQTGFSMIEILVTLLLFTFGLLGLVGLQIKAVSLSVDADDRNRAALLANDLVSQMWLTDAATVQARQLAAGSVWLTRARDPLQGGLPDVQASIAAAAGAGVPPNSWDVLIAWTPPKRGANDLNQHTLTTRVTLP